MAKRTTVGSVVKPKDGNGTDYIKIANDITLKKGDILRLESKDQQLERIDALEQSGKFDAEFAAKLRERAEKIPDFVRFEIIQLSDNDNTGTTKTGAKAAAARTGYQARR